MMDFYLTTQYDRHADGTVSNMQDYIGCFRETKNVFLLFRAGKGDKQGSAEAH